MNFFPQPSLAHPESPKLRAKQGHAKSATFARNFSELKNNPFRLYPDSVGAWRPLREQSAFSLTEVVIAMGVAAVAFTSIIALFPLGLNMSKESYEATQAALIAQTVLSDLKDAVSTTNATQRAPKLIQIKGNAEPFNANNYTSIELYNNISQTFYLAYDQVSRTDSAGTPIILRPRDFSVNAADFYNQGATNGAILVVRVIIEKTFVPDAGSRSNPQKIEVSVESPGSAKATNRTQWVFQGVIHQS
jgi:Tfp pilus assembly protein PilV